MDIRQLHYFLVLCEEMNYTRAAQRLFLSRQALRQSISALEAELCGPLFLSAHHKLTLTDRGMSLQRHATPVVEQFQQMQAALRAEIQSAQPVQEVEHQRLNELAKNHQGMVAFASAYQYSTVEAMLAEAEEKGEEPFLILLDGITDPHNLGAIIRSAECVGAHGVIVPERRAVGLTPAAVKASAGAIEHIKVARVVNMTRVIEMLKARNIWTYALTMDGTDYEKVNFKGGVALVVGSEGEGISHLVLENCDQKVSLPMAGHLDSLNASVAAGVVMYRVLSSRRA